MVLFHFSSTRDKKNMVALKCKMLNNKFLQMEMSIRTLFTPAPSEFVCIRFPSPMFYRFLYYIIFKKMTSLPFTYQTCIIITTASPLPHSPTAAAIVWWCTTAAVETRRRTTQAPQGRHSPTGRRDGPSTTTRWVPLSWICCRDFNFFCIFNCFFPSISSPFLSFEFNTDDSSNLLSNFNHFFYLIFSLNSSNLIDFFTDFS